MTEDTKALIERLRSRAREHRQHRVLRADAADTIGLMERDRDALAERCEKLRNSIKMARDAELFEDGCAADLHDAGISTFPGAYMRGRLDCLDEIEANGCLAAPKDSP